MTKKRVGLTVTMKGSNGKEVDVTAALSGVKKTDEAEIKPLNFINAAIADGYCNYKYKVEHGAEMGRVYTVSGKNCIISEDLQNAFDALRVHMPYVDDMFLHNGMEIENIEAAIDHAFTTAFRVNGFQIKGTGATENVIILGEKYSQSTGDWHPWSSTKLYISDSSRYKFAEPLREAVKVCRDEVEAYHKGKFTREVVEDANAVPKNQMSILDAGAGDDKAGSGEAHEDDDELESAKV